MSFEHFDPNSWQSLIVGPLKILMDASPSYTSEETEKFLELIRRRMVDNRALGTAPTSSIARWKSVMCDDGSPLENSLSIKKNSCIVRTSFEPLAPIEELLINDPVNYSGPTKWLAENKGEEDNLTWFNIFKEILLIKPDSGVPITSAARGLTQMGFAFDLVEKPLLKMYIWPDAISSVPHQGFESLLLWHERKSELLQEAMEAIGVSTPWQKVVKYLDNLRRNSPQFAGRPEFMSWDATDPKVARMKIYVRFAKADLSQMLEHLDLGGLLDNRHTEEIKTAAREIWNIFSNEDNIASFEMVSDELQGDDRTRGILINYELKQQENPIAKCKLCISSVLARRSIDIAYHLPSLPSNAALLLFRFGYSKEIRCLSRREKDSRAWMVSLYHQ
jgi:DMATS type aromatic prenyltransferase